MQTRKLTSAALLIAIGTLSAHLIYIPAGVSKCFPVQHAINVMGAVLLGPDYAVAIGFIIACLRNMLGTGSLLAFPGSMIGAALAGLAYSRYKTLPAAMAGEIFGTGIIGAIVSYPVMTFLWGKEGLSWMFYVPSFICGTLIGGSIAYVFLRKMASNGMLTKLQVKLNAKGYTDKSTVLSDALTIAAFGGILFVVIKLASGVFELTNPIWNTLSYAAPAVCAAAAVIYYIVKKVKPADAIHS